MSMKGTIGNVLSVCTYACTNKVKLELSENTK